MIIHVVSESRRIAKGNGVHTAFIDHVNLLCDIPDCTCIVNEEGWGDLFHSHTYGPYFFWKGLSYKGKRILTVHVIPDSIKGSLPGWRYLLPVVKWYFRQVYQYVDVCIAISPMVEEAILETGAKTRIVNIGNPIPLDKWATTVEKRKEGRAWLGLKDDAFVVLGVGQLQPRKGVEDFVDVAKAIPDAQFVWAGGRPFKNLTDGVARIDACMAHAGENCQFTGLLDLDQMPLVYAAADMLLFPSYQENCPMAPLEAAAAGLPVVFRDLPEYRSLYKAPYLRAESTASFIDFTHRLKSDSSFMRVGKQLSKQLIQQFDRGNIKQQLLGLYSDVLDETTYTMRPQQVSFWNK
jgi:1,2-diacylglycerol-3-alpha-glucose alpha-1,2-galactosyltransferase